MKCFEFCKEMQQQIIRINKINCHTPNNADSFSLYVYIAKNEYRWYKLVIYVFIYFVQFMI